MISGPRLAFLGVAALAILVAIAYSRHTRDDSLSRLREAGVVRIGYAVEPPYAFLTPSGQITGEAPEIAKHVVAALAIPHIEWRQTEFSQLISELEDGRIDVIAAGMFVTEQRARRVRFSHPTLRVRPGLLVARGNPKGIHTLRQAVSEGDARFTALAGSVEEDLLRRLGVKGPRLLAVPDALTGLKAVESGLADALLLSEPTVAWMANGDALGHTERADAGETSGNDAYGQVAFAFRHGDEALARAWDEVLAGYLGSGKHRALLASLGMSAPGPRGPGGNAGNTP